MLKSWLGWINTSLAALAVIILLGAAAITFFREKEIPHFEGPIQERALPKCSFSVDPSAYDDISVGPLKLEFSPLKMQLPDLHKSLVYYGRNGRPDAQLQSPFLHFSFTGNKTPISIPPDQRVYIKYDRHQSPPQYVFSPGNAETALWIEVTPQPNQAVVHVGMIDEKGAPVTGPQANAQFTLPEKEFTRVANSASNWEIAKLRVDGTLLARQKARWYGSDKFLERHGGPEFAHLANKQRIDLGEREEAYSIYVSPESVMIWDGSKWKVTEPGPDTLAYPLLTIKKMDDRLMTFELWDVEGKSKVTLNVLKSTEAWVPQNLQQAFKFVGARTRSQFVFEINKERIMLSPQDWLLLTDSGWKKLSTPEEIDDYVDRKITGPLFVFDGVEKRDDKQVLIGTLFNSTRTDMQQIEIPMQKNGAKEDPAQPPINNKREQPTPNLQSQDILRGRPVEEQEP